MIEKKKEGSMRRLLSIICVAVLFCSGCAGISSKTRAAYKSHLWRGQHYIASNKYEKSVKEFTEALKLGEQINRTKLPTIMLGETYVGGNEIGKASKIANKATKNWPKDSSAWELAGKVDLKKNNLNEAELSLGKALKLARRQKDRERISSLISLTKGLQAYSQANIQTTKKRFSEIKDIKLAKDVRSKSVKILGVNMAK